MKHVKVAALAGLACIALTSAGRDATATPAAPAGAQAVANDVVLTCAMTGVYYGEWSSDPASHHVISDTFVLKFNNDQSKEVTYVDGPGILVVQLSPTFPDVSDTQIQFQGESEPDASGHPVMFYSGSIDRSTGRVSLHIAHWTEGARQSDREEIEDGTCVESGAGRRSSDPRGLLAGAADDRPGGASTREALAVQVGVDARRKRLAGRTPRRQRLTEVRFA